MFCQKRCPEISNKTWLELGKSNKQNQIRLVDLFIFLFPKADTFGGSHDVLTVILWRGLDPLVTFDW